MPATPSTKPDRPTASRTGPRADVDTRAAILDAARRSFSENGYAATTLRGVARDAGVDVALIPYYFGAKRDLFTAAMELPVSPAQVIGGVFADGVDTAGPRLVETFLQLWEDPVTGPSFVAMFRSASSDEEARRSLAEFASDEIMGIYAQHLDPKDATVRAGLAASQLVGIVMLRHVLGIEPHASLPRERLVALVGPTVQHYLTGDLDG